MKRVEIAALGGCHTLGYPFGLCDSFPALLAELLGGEVVTQVGHLQFVRLSEHFATIGTQRPSHVVLQLGNYEFSASLRGLIYQLKRSLGAKPAIKKMVKPSEGAASSSTASHPPPSIWPTGFRIAGLGLLTILIWQCSPRYRRAFRGLNEFMGQHPDTDFIFLSTFPCLDPTTDALRRLGGRLLRWGLAPLPNCHWLDAHRLLRPDPALFADPFHLNQRGQRALAHGLAAIAYSQGDYGPAPEAVDLKTSAKPETA